jgi:hypothetical protein
VRCTFILEHARCEKPEEARIAMGGKCLISMSYGAEATISHVAEESDRE